MDLNQRLPRCQPKRSILLPGIQPTQRKVDVPMVVVVVQFRGDKIACERIYWDQASVHVQIGVLDRASLPVTGVEQAGKFENPQMPSNELMRPKNKIEPLDDMKSGISSEGIRGMIRLSSVWIHEL